MKITALQPQRRNKKRISVYLDGAFLFGLALETVRQLGLREGQDVERVELDRMAREEQLHQARNYAFLLLSYKARTTTELTKRLERKGFGPDIIQATLARLEELGVVDDTGFARQFVQDRVSIGHRGKRRIYAELLKRGLDRKQIDDAMKEAPDETSAAREVAAQYRKRNRDLEPTVLRRRLYGFLARRGFGPDTIAQVLGTRDEVEPSEESQ
jgi:regulatory protein